MSTESDQTLPDESDAQIYETTPAIASADDALPIRRDEVILVRDFTRADKEFVVQSWLNGLIYGKGWFGYIHPSRHYKFYTFYKEVIDKILDHTQVKVACFKDDPKTIIGYSVFEKKEDESIAHWVYVRTSWRNLGIATELLPKNTKVITHLTYPGLKIMQKHDLIFDPFAV